LFVGMFFVMNEEIVFLFVSVYLIRDLVCVDCYQYFVLSLSDYFHPWIGILNDFFPSS
jgi:hypothetical protein